jgi:ABC-2 type transport system ATP-binding protein
LEALRIEGLKKDFGSFSIENISIELPKGYILGYIGQNGAGKTTTIKLIMEQLKADRGDIKIFGTRYREDPKVYMEQIGYIADECYFPSIFNLKDVMNTLKDFYSTFDENLFRDYIKKWDLPLNQRIKNFSKGMKVKAMLAGVLSRNTKILIMDEPTGGLDPIVRSEILEILQEYISDGEKSVMFSTHIMSDLEKVADYIFFINSGKKVFFETKEDLIEKYSLIKGGLGDLDKTLEAKLIGCTKTKMGFVGLILAKDTKNLGGNFLIERPSLEEILLYYINGVKEKV